MTMLGLGRCETCRTRDAREQQTCRSTNYCDPSAAYRSPPAILKADDVSMEVRPGQLRVNRVGLTVCRRLPLLLRQRTSSGPIGMSQRCQYLTCQMRLLTGQSGLSQIHPSSPSSLDTPLNEPRVIQTSVGQWAFSLRIIWAPATGRACN